MAKPNNDKTLAKSVGEGWDAWGAACGFTSWAKAAEAIGITVAQMVTIRKKEPRKTIRLAMDAVLSQRWHGRVDTTTICEWYETYWRERQVRISPCPMFDTRHELTVADCFDDGLSHVYCTCGWVGPGALGDEGAVELHNRPRGFGIDPATPWVVHENPPAGIDVDPDELPF
ncbi:hypothetical protein ACVCL3_15920 [Rhodanobacter sp. UC4437_H4]